MRSKFNKILFFGFISEYFLIAEFRRGVWIPSLLALIQIIQNFSSLKPMFKKWFPVVAAAGVTVYLAPSLITILLFLLMLAYITKNPFYLVLSLVSFIMAILHIEGDHFTLMTQLKEGADADVVILASASHMGQLAESGLVRSPQIIALNSLMRTSWSPLIRR